jgi:hypothetical protein
VTWVTLRQSLPRYFELEIHFHNGRWPMRFHFFLLTLLLMAVCSLPVSAESSSSPLSPDPASPAAGVATKPEPPIQDNSFLVEEAYNQEDGVIQHISFVQFLSTGDMVYTQTDEWPLRNLKHQLSVTASLNESGNYQQYGPGWGDTAINYRYQLVGSGETRLAISPRLSLLLPTGESSAGRGYGSWGLQTNLPISFQLNRYLVTHWNAGVTWIPSAQDAQNHHATLVNPNLGQSTIWLLKPRFNVLCEVVWTNNATVAASGQTTRQQALFVSPGVRWAYNFKSGLQIVPGLGLPLGLMGAAGQRGAIVYLSFEHPFAWAHSR